MLAHPKRFFRPLLEFPNCLFSEMKKEDMFENVWNVCASETHLEGRTLRPAAKESSWLENELYRKVRTRLDTKTCTLSSNWVNLCALHVKASLFFLKTKEYQASNIRITLTDFKAVFWIAPDLESTICLLKISTVHFSFCVKETSQELRTLSRSGFKFLNMSGTVYCVLNH